MHLLQYDGTYGAVPRVIVTRWLSRIAMCMLTAALRIRSAWVRSSVDSAFLFEWRLNLVASCDTTGRSALVRDAEMDAIAPNLAEM